MNWVRYMFQRCHKSQRLIYKLSQLEKVDGIRLIFWWDYKVMNKQWSNLQATKESEGQETLIPVQYSAESQLPNEERQTNVDDPNVPFTQQLPIVHVLHPDVWEVHPLSQLQAPSVWLHVPCPLQFPRHWTLHVDKSEQLHVEATSEHIKQFDPREL